MSDHLTPACCICKSTQHPRSGPHLWNQRCIDEEACNARCVAGAWTEQLQRETLTKGIER